MNVRQELYLLLYEWEVNKFCENCENMATYRDNDDGRHPCNRCKNFDLFRVSHAIRSDLKKKVSAILKATRAAYKEELKNKAKSKKHDRKNS